MSEEMRILEGAEAEAFIVQKSIDALPQWAKQQIADQQAKIEHLKTNIEQLMNTCSLLDAALVAAEKEITNENP